jgi:hypothetical protein
VRVLVSVFRLIKVFSRRIENVDFLASKVCRFGLKSMYVMIVVVIVVVIAIAIGIVVIISSTITKIH